MTQKMTITDIERKQEELNLEKAQLGMETSITEDEKFIMNVISERDKKLKVGLGTMIFGRLLFGKFSK